MYCRVASYPFTRAGRKGRDPRNLCGRAAEEDDASLDQTGTGMCQSHTSHHFSLDDRLWEQLIVDSQDWLTHSVFLPIFTALISTPKFEDVYSSCFPAVQARDMQEVFRQAKLRTTRRCVDAWKALSSAERFYCMFGSGSKLFHGALSTSSNSTCWNVDVHR